VTQRWFEDSIVAFVEQASRFRAPAFIGNTVYPERVLLKNQRGETVLEGEHTHLIAYRPAA
jgi:acyl dehydratase